MKRALVNALGALLMAILFITGASAAAAVPYQTPDDSFSRFEYSSIADKGIILASPVTEDNLQTYILIGIMLLAVVGLGSGFLGFQIKAIKDRKKDAISRRNDRESNDRHD